MVIQENLSVEEIYIQMAFHFLDKDMMRTILAMMIKPKLEYAEVIWSSRKKKHVLKLERIQRIATKMVPESEDLTCEERFKKMHIYYII